MRIAYLTSMYPDVSHTFILREVRALRARGLEVVTFSVRRPRSKHVLGEDALEEAAATRWLVPPRVTELVAAWAWFAATRPLLMGRTLLDAVACGRMTIGRRFKWLCYFAEAVLLASWLVAESVDQLHCHFGNAGSSAGMLAARLAGIPFSMTCHGSELREIETHRLADKVAHAAFVACVSKHGRAQLMLACAPELWNKLHIVRCGVEKVERSRIATTERGLHLLCVGRLSPEKGHLVLLDALACLRERGIDFLCTLVGDGPMRATVMGRAEELGLTDLLTFTGALGPEKVSELYELADVVVLPSFSEGVPVVLMEAMSYGLPVVATCVGGVPELVKDGSCGLLVPPGDAEALADAVHSLCDDPDLAKSLACNGKRRVHAEFNVDASAAKLADLFGQECLSGEDGGVEQRVESESCLT